MKKLTKKQLYESYLPGSFGFHELVDRACLIAELFSDNIAQHPAAKHPKLRKQIAQIENDLFDLYRDARELHV